MSEFITSVTETLKSPTTWAIWMFVSSVILLFLLMRFIEKISKGIIIGVIAGLLLYGIHIVSTTNEFNQMSVYLILASIISIIIFSGILIFFIKYIILGALLCLIAFGSYTLIQLGSDKNSVKAQTMLKETTENLSEKIEEPSNWKKFIF